MSCLRFLKKKTIKISSQTSGKFQINCHACVFITTEWALMTKETLVSVFVGVSDGTTRHGGDVSITGVGVSEEWKELMQI